MPEGPGRPGGFGWFGLLRALGRRLLALPAAVAWLPAVAWAALIWTASSDEIRLGDDDNPLWPIVGNLAHAPMFGLLALFVAALVLRPQRGSAWPRVTWGVRGVVLAVVLAWGVLDEWHQSWVPGRDSTWRDVLIDVVGAVLVLETIAYLGRADAGERGLRVRLLGGIGLCVALAVVTTVA